MVVDFHTHNFPDALAPRAIAAMCEKLEGRLVPVGDGTVATQLKDMDAAGVDASVLCPIATRPSQFETILRRSDAIRAGREGAAAAERIWPIASLHVDDPDFAAHARAIAAEGFRGVAFHPYYQDFRLDDPRVWPLFAALRDEGLFAAAHCGGDTGYPDSPMACGPNEIAALMEHVPGLTFVACHLGGMNGNPPGSVERLLPFATCLFDTAVLNQDDGSAEADRIVSTWPAERLMFGTDYFWRDERPLLDWVRSRRPDPAALDLILSGNVRRLLGR